MVAMAGAEQVGERVLSLGKGREGYSQAGLAQPKPERVSEMPSHAWAGAGQYAADCGAMASQEK
jgi:hypothetical protein